MNREENMESVFNENTEIKNGVGEMAFKPLNSEHIGLYNFQTKVPDQLFSLRWKADFKNFDRKNCERFPKSILFSFSEFSKALELVNTTF